jgi:hypothetical protein
VTVDPGTLRSPPVLALPPGGAVLSVAPGGSAQIRLRRFATASFPLQPARLRGGAPTILKIPTDRSSVPWQAETTSSGRLTACAR